MLLCISYHKGSEIFAQAQVDYLKHLCGKLPYPILYLVGEGAEIDYKGISDDITEIHVDFSDIPYPFVANEMFRVAAQHAFESMVNFVWLETDCLILRPDFITALETELLMSGKRAVLTSHSNPPHDLISGIGAYRHDVVQVWKDAIDTPIGGWDGAIIRLYPHDVKRSNLIYHKYGDYDAEGRAHPYEFQLDEMQDAVIAHKLWDLKIYEVRRG